MLKNNAEQILLKDFIDVEIIDRKKQLEEIENEILKPLLKDQTLPKLIYIYGGSGSGKTFLIKKMEEKILKARTIFREFFYIYYNASEYGKPSLYSLVLEIVSALHKFFPFWDKEKGEKIYLPKRGVPLEDIIKCLKLVIDRFKPTILVVIDEIDKFDDFPSVIKWLAEMRAKYNEYWGLTSILISNDPYLLERIKEEVKTRISYTIFFTPYTIQDFYEIAKLFVSKCFNTKLPNELIIKIAKKVNEISSSVRDLKLTLYFFGKEGKLDEESINLAIDKSQMEIFKKEILSRPLQQKLVLFAIASFHKRISEYEERRMKGLVKYTLLPTLKNIYNEYVRIAKNLTKINPLCEPRKYTTFFNMIRNLEDAQLISVEVRYLGKGKGRTSFVFPKNASWEYYYEVLESEFQRV